MGGTFVKSIARVFGEKINHIRRVLVVSGPINYILSLDIFQPLSKLSYCNYLIHMSLQDYRLFSTRINHYFKYFNLVSFHSRFCVFFSPIFIPFIHRLSIAFC